MNIPRRVLITHPDNFWRPRCWAHTRWLSADLQVSCWAKTSTGHSCSTDSAPLRRDTEAPKEGKCSDSYLLFNIFSWCFYLTCCILKTCVSYKHFLWLLKKHHSRSGRADRNTRVWNSNSEMDVWKMVLIHQRNTSKVWRVIPRPCLALLHNCVWPLNRGLSFADGLFSRELRHEYSAINVKNNT